MIYTTSSKDKTIRSPGQLTFKQMTVLAAFRPFGFRPLFGASRTLFIGEPLGRILL